jgi:hypothetical protein
VPITTKVVRSDPVHGEVYSIKTYVIKFVSDLQQLGGFKIVNKLYYDVKKEKKRKKIKHTTARFPGLLHALQIKTLFMYHVKTYVIKFVSDLQQLGGFLRILRFPLPIKLTATI